MLVMRTKAASRGGFLAQEQSELAQNFLGDGSIRALQVWGGELLLSSNARITIHDSLDTPVIISRWALSDRAYYHRPARLVRRHERRSFVISFVDGGLVNLIPSGRSDTISSGHFTVTKFSNGYSATLLPDLDEIMTTKMAVIPDHLLLPELKNKSFLGRSISSREGLGLAAKESLDLLLQHGRMMNGDMRNSAISLFLGFVTACLNAGCGTQALLPDRSKRFDDILQYIVDNAGNPNLSAKVVARYFRISTRYLTTILRSNDEKFPSLLRRVRMELGARLLQDLDASAHNISEIAVLSGFKNSSHFSRIFRSVNGCSPTRYRYSLCHRERRSN